MLHNLYTSIAKASDTSGTSDTDPVAAIIRVTCVSGGLYSKYQYTDTQLVVLSLYLFIIVLLLLTETYLCRVLRGVMP